MWLAASVGESCDARFAGSIRAILIANEVLMRPIRFVLLSVLFQIALLMSAISSTGQNTEDKEAGPRGTAPRASADRYHTHAQRDSVNIGAQILPPKQITKAFFSDLNRCCLVVEFAFYPKKGAQFDLSLDDFAIFESGKDVPEKPGSPIVIAALLQKKARSGSAVQVTSGASVGYESGTYTDPATGQPMRAHGVYTSVGAGVGVSNPNPVPVSTDRDRQIMEKELTEKGLPEGKAAAPVAGYLYFSVPQRKKNAKYQLEYNLNGEKLLLPLS
jgi:hypothetical protein